MDWAIAIARAKVRARRSSRYMPREAAGSEYQGDDAAGRGVVRLVATEGACARTSAGRGTARAISAMGAVTVFSCGID